MTTNVNVNPNKLVDKKVEYLGTTDLSKVEMSRNPTTNPYTSIHVIFSSEGKGNVFYPFNDVGELMEEYGSDLTNIKAYGQQGANAVHALQGGGKVFVMRAIPEDVGIAKTILCVAIKEEEKVPQYQKDEDGYYITDNEDNRIPLMEDVLGPDSQPTGEKQQVTRPGYRIKLIAKEAGKKNDSQISSEAGWKVYPLMKFTSYKEGKCGNNYGFSIECDYPRSKQTSDGRRYLLNLFKADNRGTVSLLEGDIAFSFNTEALFSTNSTISEGITDVYQNRDPNKGYHYRDMLLEYYEDNYTQILSHLSQRFDSDGESDFEIDFITCTDEYAQPYETLLLDEASIDFGAGERVFLSGGHEGSLQVGASVPGPEGTPVTVTEEMVEATKLKLLERAYTFQLDKRLADCRKVYGGVLYDANYDISIKKIIGTTLIKIRPDIFVFFDCGITSNYQEAITMARDIKSVVNTSNFNIGIFPHCGTSKSLNIRGQVTQTFELAFSIPYLFAKKDPYVIFAGYGGGYVRNLLLSWAIDGEDEEEQMKKYDLNYISDYGDLSGSADRFAEREYYMMCERTLYNDEYSVLKSVRNAMIVTCVMRLVRRVMVKYTYSSETVSTNLATAKNELTSLSLTSFPSNVSISYNLYQTAKDQVQKSGTVDVDITFPDQTETFKFKIYVHRTKLNGTI